MKVGPSPVMRTALADKANRYRQLRTLNVAAFLFLAAEAAYMLLASDSLSLPVTASYLTDDPVLVTRPTMPESVFSVRIGPAVACFLLLAAIDHAVVAAPAPFTR